MALAKSFTFDISADELDKIKALQDFLKKLNIDFNESETVKEYSVKIIMNEEKILKDDIYNLEDVYQKIDELAILSNMKKEDKYTYISKNNSPSDLGNFVWNNLEECDWFMNNVKEFIWFDKEDGRQDILQYIKKRK